MANTATIERLEEQHREELRRKDNRIDTERRRLKHLREYIELRIQRCRALLEEADQNSHQGLHARISELQRLKELTENPFLSAVVPKVRIPEGDPDA